jgi:hypothetical protein
MADLRQGGRLATAAESALLGEGVQSRYTFVALVAGLLLTACGPGPETSQTPPDGGDWREFEGTWTAAGTRHAIPMGGARRSSVSTLDGSMVLSGPTRPGAGFRAEAIVLNDTATGMVGRAVWTDERGDHLYSELRGQATAAGNQVEGRFVGGTGRYARAEGQYAFTWRFVLETEDGSVQGQSIGLKGRVRNGPPDAAPAAGGARP